MAKVIKEFDGVPDGEHSARTFRVGDDIEDGTDLHRVAVEMGWVKGKPAPKNKARAAPTNKSGAASQAARVSRRRTLREFLRLT